MRCWNRLNHSLLFIIYACRVTRKAPSPFSNPSQSLSPCTNTRGHWLHRLDKLTTCTPTCSGSGGMFNFVARFVAWVTYFALVFLFFSSFKWYPTTNKQTANLYCCSASAWCKESKNAGSSSEGRLWGNAQVAVTRAVSCIWAFEAVWVQHFCMLS